MSNIFQGKTINYIHTSACGKSYIIRGTQSSLRTPDIVKMVCNNYTCTIIIIIHLQIFYLTTVEFCMSSVHFHTFGMAVLVPWQSMPLPLAPLNTRGCPHCRVPGPSLFQHSPGSSEPLVQENQIRTSTLQIFCFHPKKPHGISIQEYIFSEIHVNGKCQTITLQLHGIFVIIHVFC